MQSQAIYHSETATAIKKLIKISITQIKTLKHFSLNNENVKNTRLILIHLKRFLITLPIVSDRYLAHKTLEGLINAWLDSTALNSLKLNNRQILNDATTLNKNEVNAMKEIIIWLNKYGKNSIHLLPNIRFERPAFEKSIDQNIILAPHPSHFSSKSQVEAGPRPTADLIYYFAAVHFNQNTFLQNIFDIMDIFILILKFLDKDSLRSASLTSRKFSEAIQSTSDLKNKYYESSYMTLFLKKSTGEKLRIKCHPENKIVDLYNAVGNKERYGDYRFIFSSKQLYKEKKVKDYNIQDNSIINIVSRRR